MAEARYVSLCVAAETFAVPVAMVREILDYAEPFRLPGGPAYLIGVIDVRGQAVPVADLRLRLGLPRREPDESTRVLVLDLTVDAGVQPLGIMADKVRDVVAIPPEEIQAPQIGGSAIPNYIAGLARLGDGFVAILDPAKLFEDQPMADAAA